jgi:hypothetical protein
MPVPGLRGVPVALDNGDSGHQRGLRARLRGDRVEAARMAISRWPVSVLLKIKNPAGPAK